MTSEMATSTMYLAEVRDLRSQDSGFSFSFCETDELLVRDWALRLLVKRGVSRDEAEHALSLALPNRGTVATADAQTAHSVTLTSNRFATARTDNIPTRMLYRLYQDDVTEVLSLVDGEGITVWVQDSDEIDYLVRTLLETMTMHLDKPAPYVDVSYQCVPRSELLFEVAARGNRAILLSAQAVPLALVSLQAFLDILSDGLPGCTEFGDQSLFVHALGQVLATRLAAPQ